MPIPPPTPIPPQRPPTRAPQTPTAPAAPASPMIEGVPIAQPSLEGLRLQAQALTDQLSALEGQRRGLLAELRAAGRGTPARAGTLEQLSQINGQIAQVTTDLGSVRAQIAIRQSQMTRTVMSEPRFRERDRGLNGDQVAAMSIVFMLVTFFPLSIAFARRLWRRGSVVPQVDGMIAPRLDRLEQAVDAIAIEIERISEGQRFVTRVLVERPIQQPAQTAAKADGAPLGEGAPLRALGAGPAEPIRMPERQSVRQSITPH